MVNKADNELRRAYRVPEVAELLAVSEKSVRARIKTGDLPAFRIGREYRIPPEELELWIDHHRIPSVISPGGRR
jgi:excisionase family DNA binding protein